MRHQALRVVGWTSLQLSQMALLKLRTKLAWRKRSPKPLGAVGWTSLQPPQNHVSGKDELRKAEKGPSVSPAGPAKKVNENSMREQDESICKDSRQTVQGPKAPDAPAAQQSTGLAPAADEVSHEADPFPPERVFIPPGKVPLADGPNEPPRVRLYR